MSSSSKPLVVALAGMTISSPDLPALKHIFTHGLEWDVLTEGHISAAEEQAWGIARGSAGGGFCIVRSPQSTRGMVRLVQGGTRPRQAPVAARWAGIEIIVSRDIDALYERLKDIPQFRPLRDPITMDWSDYGSNLHRAFLGIVPGGTHISLTMGLTQPKGRAFPKAQAWAGHVFDVPLMTAAFDRSADFYRGTLGMAPILTSRFNDGLSWHELFHLPKGADVALDILKGDAPDTGLGGIEMQGYDAALIDTDAADPAHFDGGACMVSYTTHDIDTAYGTIAKAPAARVLSKPQAVQASPYQGARAFSFLGPDGERFEICERLWT